MNSNPGGINPVVFKRSKTQEGTDLLLKRGKLFAYGRLIPNGKGMRLPEHPVWKKEMRKEKTGKKNEDPTTPSHRTPPIKIKRYSITF
jgi:hypothetical protein